MAATSKSTRSSTRCWTACACRPRWPCWPIAFRRAPAKQLRSADLQQLSTRLEAQGVILRSGETPQPHTAGNPQASSLLALHYHRDIISAQALAPFARLLQVLFTRPAAVVIVALIALAHVLAYRQVGFPPNLQMGNVNCPLLYGVMLASFLLHELGHLAACRRWHCPHGPLGFGLYFFNPVFYVNVTAAWRLNRRQRAVLDLGGIYVQLAFISALSAAYWLLHDNTFLLALLLTDLLVLSNFEPFMKLDGYWLLSDLAGVPNLHAPPGRSRSTWWVWLQSRLGRRSAAVRAAHAAAALVAARAHGDLCLRRTLHPDLAAHALGADPDGLRRRHYLSRAVVHGVRQPPRSAGRRRCGCGACPAAGAVHADADADQPGLLAQASVGPVGPASGTGCSAAADLSRPAAMRQKVPQI